MPEVPTIGVTSDRCCQCVPAWYIISESWTAKTTMEVDQNGNEAPCGLGQRSANTWGEDPREG